MRLLRGGLIVLTLLSALAVVFVKFENRMLFGQIHDLEEQLIQLEIERGRLSLEESTLSEHNRIERDARRKVGLIPPGPLSIKYITRDK